MNPNNRLSLEQVRLSKCLKSDKFNQSSRARKKFIPKNRIVYLNSSYGTQKCLPLVTIALSSAFQKHREEKDL